MKDVPEPPPPETWPLRGEIQAAKADLRAAETWEEQMECLRRIQTLTRHRAAIMADLDILDASGEGLVA